GAADAARVAAGAPAEGIVQVVEAAEDRVVEHRPAARLRESARAVLDRVDRTPVVRSLCRRAEVLLPGPCPCPAERPPGAARIDEHAVRPSVDVQGDAD